MLTLSLLAWGATPGFAQIDTLSRIRLLEATGRFDSARTLLESFSGKLAPGLKQHRVLLLHVDSALKRSAYFERSSLEIADQELKRLDIDSGEVGLRIAVANRLKHLDDQRRTNAGLAALAIARRLKAQENLELAVAEYAKIQADSGNQFPPGIRNTAAKELGQVRRTLEDRAGFGAGLRETWIQTRHGLGALTVWLGVVLFVWGVAFAVRRLARPRTGAVLDVEDMTVEPDQRGDAKARLLRDISRAVRVLARTRGSSLGEKLEDLDGVPNLRTNSPVLEEIDKLVADGTLKLGPVELNPKQLIWMFGVVGDRPYETTLKGYLTSDDANTTLLFIERFDVIKRKRVKHPNYYQSTGGGPLGRRQAIRDFAIRYIFDHTTNSPTASFESFRDYCRGLDQLENEDDGGALKAARGSLENALLHDPLNWLARFKLAEVLRKQGDYEAAALHFEELSAMNKDESLQPPSLVNYLRANPGYPFIVEYNVALTMSLGFDHQAQQQGIAKFDALIDALLEAS